MRREEMGKAEKRKEICNAVGKSRKSMLKWMLLIVTALLAGASVVLALNIPGLGKSERIKPVKGAVAIPIAKVSDGKAHFYRIDDGGKAIGFFVVKGSDGALHTAFDACDVCYQEKKGYVQDGDFMICKNCNKKFAVVRIGPHAIGGCNPSYLPHLQSAGNIVISINDLKTGARFF
jgi:uncharacterized membrane protein